MKEAQKDVMWPKARGSVQKFGSCTKDRSFFPVEKGKMKDEETMQGLHRKWQDHAKVPLMFAAQRD